MPRDGESKSDAVARHHRWAKWFWAANFPVVILLYLYLDERLLLLYLAIVSVYANFASEASTEQGALGRDD